MTEKIEEKKTKKMTEQLLATNHSTSARLCFPRGNENPLDVIELIYKFLLAGLVDMVFKSSSIMDFRIT